MRSLGVDYQCRPTAGNLSLSLINVGALKGSPHPLRAAGEAAGDCATGGYTRARAARALRQRGANH